MGRQIQIKYKYLMLVITSVATSLLLLGLNNSESTFAVSSLHLLRHIFANDVVVSPLKSIQSITSDTIQQERQKRMAEYCSTRPSNKYSPNLYNFGHGRVTFCRINKCASTFALRSLDQLFPCTGTDCWQETAPREEKNNIGLKSYSEKRRIFRNSFSLLFSREPYRRLFSTYCNKFYLPKEFWAPIGPAVVRRYRKNPSKESLEYGHDLTFLELIKYVVDEFENDRDMDVHIRPMHSMCDPCNYKYNFIGALETLQTDWEVLVKAWEIGGLTNRSRTSHDDSLAVMSELKHVRNTIKLPRKKNLRLQPYSLYQRAWAYYQIVGRISKTKAMPFSPTDTITDFEYHRSIMNAIAASKPLREQVDKQRDEALIQAYATIPRDVLERLRKVVLLDCKLFGYDDRPEQIFNAPSHATDLDHDYFEGL